MPEVCVKNCEFLRFNESTFNCLYYESDLKAEVDDLRNVSPLRCEECIKEGIMGKETTHTQAQKIKKILGLMGDSFYSYKDDFETLLTEMYRVAKKMEDDSE